MKPILCATLMLSVIALCSACHRTPVSFDSHRASLYSQAELLSGYNGERNIPGFDSRVYQEYIAQGKFYPSAEIAELRSAHDDGVATALRVYVGPQQKNLIAVMGSGSAKLRCSDAYRNTARLAWKMSHDGGYRIETGGGPGQMEAANLGAYLSDQPIAEIDDALEIMRSHAKFDPATKALPPKGSDTCEFEREEYAAAAEAVIQRYPRGHESLGIPTWFYGNEPTNRFATILAKFFSNGIREDLLVSTAVGGIVIAPGAAGTRQEIFMDGAKIYYGTFCYLSPTVFFGTKAYGALPPENEKDPGNPGLYDLVRRLTPGAPKLLTLTDDADETLKFFRDHPPQRVESDPVACKNMP